MNRKGFTESEIAAALVRIAETDAGTLLRRRLDSVKHEIAQTRGLLEANVTTPRIEALEKESKALEVKYLEIVNARRSRSVELLFSEAEYRLKSDQKNHSAELASVVQSAKMYTEKRNALAREITDGEAPRTTSHGIEKLRRLKAARDIVESQLLHATYGDQKPSATAPDAKLDRVLSELVDLRAEVKRLRDGK